MEVATTIYKATCFLMLGLTIQYSCLWYSLYQVVFLGADMDIVTAHWRVAVSKILVIACLGFYAYHITNKINRESNDHIQRNLHRKNKVAKILNDRH